jgi:uncharacterized protein (TIGR02117 family)
MKKMIKYSLLFFFGAPLLYCLMAYLLGHLSVNNDFKQSANGIEIFVKSNGAHTDIIVPLKNEICDWTSFVSIENSVAKDINARFVALGWGDKGFFLETPTWGDLKFSTAFKALFALSTSAMHVEFRHKAPKLSESCKSIRISPEQYHELVKYMKNSFTKDPNGLVIPIVSAHYDKHDAFYEAKGRYHLFKTCNEWTRQGLSTIGVKCAFWSVMDESVLRFLE